MDHHHYFVCTAVCISALFGYPKTGRCYFAGSDPYSLEAMTAFVKESLHQLTHNQLSDLGLHEEEYRRRLNKRSELRSALKGCVSGDVLDKAYVKDF